MVRALECNVVLEGAGGSSGDSWRAGRQDVAAGVQDDVAEESGLLEEHHVANLREGREGGRRASAMRSRAAAHGMKPFNGRLSPTGEYSRSLTSTPG